MKQDIGINEHEESREMLKYQARFEKMVADISSTFVGKPEEDVDEAIDFALAKSGKFFRADRSFLFRFSDNYESMTNTHEWVAPGIASQRARNQGYLLDHDRWWLQETLQGKSVNVSDVEALPEEMAKDKEEFRAEDIRSFVTIPLVRKGRVFGYFGFDGIKEVKSWTEGQLALLKVVGEIITAAIIKHETAEALKESEERYRDILNTMEEGYYEADLTGTVVFCNEAAGLYLGYKKEELVGKNYRMLFMDPERAYLAFNHVYLREQKERGLVIAMKRRDESSCYVELSISLQKDKAGNVIGFKGIGKDVTERIEHEERLKYVSMHDQLTGIFNRSYFEVELERLEKSREYPISIISADLDGLKLVNDTMGHDAGDRQLKACADLVRQSLRRSDILARIGGDEFAAILTDADEDTVKSVVRRIRENLSTYNLRNKNLPLGISLGWATAGDDSTGLKVLLKQADDMMYREKLYTSSSGSRSKIVQSLLATLAERDYISGGHARRLEKLCLAMGEKLNLSKRQLSDLSLLAQVHDLGKVGIPDHILFKPASLSVEEWEVMHVHPEKGYRIALSSPELSSVAELILKHHERWDGRGYPLGLKGEAIPVECRILSIVDAFDAMVSKRPYNKIKSVKEAVKEIENHVGSQFDPDLFPVFVEVLDELKTGVDGHSRSMGGIFSFLNR